MPASNLKRGMEEYRIINTKTNEIGYSTQLNNMELGYTKYFLRVFLSLLDRKKDRAAIRFLYRHTAFRNIYEGETLFDPNSPAANGKLMYVAEGLVNGYITDESEKPSNIWLGRSGSTYICDDFSYTDHSFNIQAIEHSTLFIIDKCEFEEGCAWYPVLDSLFHFYFLRNAINDVNNRNILFRLQNIESRTSLFRRIYPDLYERIPADLLISYLDPDAVMDPEPDLQLDDANEKSIMNFPWPKKLIKTYLD
jgi:CRP-like cAMP-binding protein